MIETGEQVRVYRIVSENPPTERDFYSRARLGKSQYVNESDRDYHEGISVFDDLAYTIQKAKFSRFQLGEFVAELEIPESGMEIAQTTKNRHHFDVYASPERLLALVTRVYPAKEERGWLRVMS